MDFFAYLDPGTGSIILQAVIGALVGAGVLVKVYWNKLLATFSKKSDDSSKDLRSKSSDK